VVGVAADAASCHADAGWRASLTFGHQLFLVRPVPVELVSDVRPYPAFLMQTLLSSAFHPDQIVILAEFWDCRKIFLNINERGRLLD
jgi:hypothetical protein